MLEEKMNCCISHKHSVFLAIIICMIVSSTVYWATRARTRIVMEPTPVQPPMVLIVAYKRGGSTFTGSIFRDNPEAFYVFEPLKHLYHHIIKSPNFRSLENTAAAQLGDTISSAKDLIFAILTCKCRRQCCANFTSKCQNSQHRAIKTIRLHMSEARELLDRLPSLKIVHLLRDPRGIISSRLRSPEDYNTMEEALSGAEELCENIRDDLEEAEKIKRDYPGRLFTLFYEELAENPLSITENVYSALNLPFTNSVKKSLRLKTHAEHDSPGMIGTSRKNSTKTAYKWRKTYTDEHIDIIDKTCQKVYQMTGYLSLNEIHRFRRRLTSGAISGDTN